MPSETPRRHNGGTQADAQDRRRVFRRSGAAWVQDGHRVRRSMGCRADCRVGVGWASAHQIHQPPPPSFPRRRESRSVGAETYRIKRFLEIPHPRFPLSWE
ncbi:TPA: hypothetical protein ACFNMZ_001033 [Neisseria polysaccharea]